MNWISGWVALLVGSYGSMALPALAQAGLPQADPTARDSVSPLSRPELLPIEVPKPASGSESVPTPEAGSVPALTELSPTSTTESPTAESATAESPTTESFGVFPVGLNLDRRNVVPSTLVRGREDGHQAIAFSQWLLPFETVMTALQFRITPLEDGQLELRSPGVIRRLDPNTLTVDSRLGLVIAIAEIETLLGVPSEFDIEEYAIVFRPPWLTVATGRVAPDEIPVLLDGLPKRQAADFVLGTVSQRLESSGTVNNAGNTGRWGNTSFGSGRTLTDHRGDLSGVGTLFGGSWFFRVNQADLPDTQSWQLSEFQYLHQTDRADYAIATQPQFWFSPEGGQYWGITTIQRWGFTPPPSVATGSGFTPSQRLQAETLDRTIGGQAPPGTLVRLVRGFQNEVMGEVLVDASGVYRFEHVPTGQRGGASYRVLLYPNGQLTATPDERVARFLNVTGQLPHRASALILSSGMRRELGNQNDFFGELTNLQGGVAYRQGISEDLTLGIGTIYQDTPRILGEVFYQPNAFPLQVSLSALSTKTQNGLNINSNLVFQPLPRLSISFNSDLYSERANLNWQLLPNLLVFVDGNRRTEVINGGFQTSLRQKNFFTTLRIATNTHQQWQWNVDSRFERLKLSSLGNEAASNSRLSYNVSTQNLSQISLDIGHSVLFDYATSHTTSDRDYLATLGWRYRSQKQLNDGRYLWDIDFSYGSGSQGQGVIAAASTGVLPGLALRARYQQIAVTSNEDSFRVEVVPILNFQQGIHPDDTRFTDLRTLGGLLIQPFFDENNNGDRDAGEKLYRDNPELLIVLNHQPIAVFRPDTRRNGVYVRLSPDTYRLDLDPAGYPLDWKPVETAYAVEVVPGSYTPVQIPLILSYTVTGVLTDGEGAAIGGARVEAVPTAGGLRKLSVTNGAGVFVLENLSQGTYQLLINGNPAQPDTLTIEAETPAFQELNLRSAIP